jgi:hypothetical protein
LTAIWTLNTHFGVVVSNPSGEKLLQMQLLNSKSQRHNVRLIIPLREMEMCWMLWSIRISDSHMSESGLRSLTKSIYSTSWITLVLETLGTNRKTHSLSRIIGRFWGNLGSLNVLGKAITFASFQDVGKCESRMQRLIKWVKWTSRLLGRHLRHSFGMPSIPQAFRSFRETINFCKSRGLIFSGGHSRAWTLASTRPSCFPSHRLCGVTCFSKQSAIALVFSNGWNVMPKEPRIEVGALSPSLFMRDFAMGHIPWGIASVFANVVSQRSSAFFESRV